MHWTRIVFVFVRSFAVELKLTHIAHNLRIVSVQLHLKYCHLIWNVYVCVDQINRLRIDISWIDSMLLKANLHRQLICGFGFSKSYLTTCKKILKVLNILIVSFTRVFSILCIFLSFVASAFLIPGFSASVF